MRCVSPRVRAQASAAHSLLFTRSVRSIDVLLADSRGAADSVSAPPPPPPPPPPAPVTTAPTVASAAAAAVVPSAAAAAPPHAVPRLLYSVAAVGRDDTPALREAWNRLGSFVAGPDPAAPLSRDALYAKCVPRRAAPRASDVLFGFGLM